MGQLVASAKGRYARAHRYDRAAIDGRKRDLEYAKTREQLERAISSSPLPFTRSQSRDLAQLIRTNAEGP